MKNNIVITIGRECGSGGRQIGQLLAEKLGVKCYDKELIALASKESGLCEEVIESLDEKPTSSFLYSLVSDSYFRLNSSMYNEVPLNQKVYLAQFNTIKKLAESESCVIVGRCADYALSDNEHALHVFITGDVKDKVAYLMEINNIGEKEAKELMIKVDKKRSSYYNHYTDKRWGNVKGYDLCINSSVLGHEGTADLIYQMLAAKEHLVTVHTSAKT
ncbi:Cytidylate kinase [Lachnospiraceae bacterium TWA4]|nr:Cytidylate kinase [Lachnospiraceae bacterium TWA4]